MKIYSFFLLLITLTGFKSVLLKLLEAIARIASIKSFQGLLELDRYNVVLEKGYSLSNTKRTLLGSLVLQHTRKMFMMTKVLEHLS